MDKKLKKELVKKSNSMKAMFQIGKNGLSNESIVSINEYIEKNELLKIKVLQNNTDEMNDIVSEILVKTRSELVHKVGGTITIYREKRD